ncbi:MAG TPA: hypothetical protein VGO07_03485 [Candidatus Saccharimonadales bacterium]|jgi:hypothetical protein|nr:hypothetical protein [Candidatus Saccharimonadales bacterium]
MSEVILSSAQVELAVGMYSEAAVRSGINTAEFDRDVVPSPSYDEVAAAYYADARQSSFEVPAYDSARLGGYPGLRVVVGTQVRTQGGASREVFFPGIVLPDQTKPGDPAYAPTTIGFLKAGPDAILDAMILAERTSRPLADIQHTLLEQLYGMHKPGTGEHGQYTANVADAAHGSLIAITGVDNVGGLHSRVHNFMADGLAPSVANTSALDIAVGHQVRKVRESTLPATATSRIIIAREHQLPAYRGTARLGAGELAVGVALAAVRSKKNQQYPQPNLSVGMDAILR